MHTCEEFEEREDTTSTDAERRTRARFPTDDAARMEVVQPLGTKAAEVRILDVSKDGLKLRVPDSLRPGSIVQIYLKSALVVAEVRYCVQADFGFYAGVLLQNVVWTGDSPGN